MIPLIFWQSICGVEGIQVTVVLKCCDEQYAANAD